MTVNSILIVPFSLHKRQTTFMILILFSLCWYTYSHVYLCSIDYSLSFSILQPILMCMRNYFKIIWIIMRENFIRSYIDILYLISQFKNFLWTYIRSFDTINQSACFLMSLGLKSTILHPSYTFSSNLKNL